MFQPSLYLLESNLNYNKDESNEKKFNKENKSKNNSWVKKLAKKEKTLVFKKVDINKNKKIDNLKNTIKIKENMILKEKNIKENIKKENKYKTNFSFKPKINKNSLLIASKLENSFSRLTKSPLKESFVNKNSFKNDVIKSPIKRKKFGRENWLLYYKKLSIENINNKIKEKELQEDIEFNKKCSFSPNINRNNSNNLINNSFYKRISNWNFNKNNKIKKLKRDIELKIQNSNKKNINNSKSSFKKSPIPKNFSKNNPTGKSIIKYLQNRKTYFKDKFVKDVLDKKYKVWRNSFVYN